MDQTTARWILLLTLSVLLNLQTRIQAQQVPCMFLFGDSQFDNGNNNNLATSSRCNYSPYGIDFPDGPTGRYTNGRNIADFLAIFLGFARSMSPFVNARGSDILRGVNYASGDAGIRDESGMNMGQRFTMNMQLANHQATINKIKVLLGNQTATNDYLNRCLYVVNIGSNDYINNYYLPSSTSSQLYTPDQFAAALVQQLNQQLTILYKLNARKVALYGLGLIGCLPQEIDTYTPTNGSLCVEYINNAVQLFNNRIPPLINNMNNNLAGANFTYLNYTSMSLGDPSLTGITVGKAPCCPVLASNGLCDPNGVPCSNRNEYIFWDNIHPTEIFNHATASRSYHKLVEEDAYPYDIQTLVQS